MIKRTIDQYVRVLKVARKPTKEEYVRALKITGAGIGILGSIGFAFYTLFMLLKMVGIY